MRIHIATGLAVRDERVLLVASQYANHAQPLWNLPGGRQRADELLSETAIRETFEETGLRARCGGLAYLSESYAGEDHVLNATFRIELDAFAQPRRAWEDGEHVVDAEWVPIERLASVIAVAVVREPLLACLRGELPFRYAGFHDAGVTIRWPSGSS